MNILVQIQKRGGELLKVNYPLRPMPFPAPNLYRIINPHCTFLWYDFLPLVPGFHAFLSLEVRTDATPLNTLFFYNQNVGNRINNYRFELTVVVAQLLF